MTIKLYTIASDTDGGTGAAVYLTKEEQDKAWAECVALEWENIYGEDDTNMPDDPEEAWNTLTQTSINTFQREESTLQGVHLITDEELEKLHEFFDRTMGKMNVGKSWLDAQAIANWNESGIIVGKLMGAHTKEKRDAKV